MKLSALRYLGTATLVGLSTFTFSLNASAEAIFTVQLGSFESEKQARDHWTNIQERFPDIFEPLKYASAEVQLPPGGLVYHRTQAGPIPSRREAEEICQKLLVKGFECYVAETAMFDAASVAKKQAMKAPPPPPPAAAKEMPPKALPPVIAKNQVAEVDMMETDEIREMFSPNTAEATRQPQKVLPKPQNIVPPVPVAEAVQSAEKVALKAPLPQTPVQKPAPITYASAPPKSKITLPKPVGAPFEVGESTHAATAKTAQKNMPPKAPSPQTTVIQGKANEKARVRVAEAVPVPLAKVEKQTGAFEQERKQTFRGYPSQYFNQSSLWAEMSHFKSQQAALSYWQTVMSRDAAIPHGLRLRVIKPLRKYAAKNKLSLRVGPFKTTRAIRRLCSLTQPEKIRCRAVKDLGTSITLNKKRERFSPQQLKERRIRNVKMFTKPASTSGEPMYYLHLGSFRTSELAMRKWQDLSARHQVLSGLNEHVASPNYSSAIRQRFRLRAGPFARSMDAVSVCDELKRAGTMCVITKDR